MTHTQFIKFKFNVIAETDNAILFEAYGELCCEINGAEFACSSKEEFWAMVELFGDDDFAQ